MKQQLNEIHRMQQLAGIILENNLPNIKWSWDNSISGAEWDEDEDGKSVASGVIYGIDEEDNEYQGEWVCYEHEIDDLDDSYITDIKRI